MDMDTFFLFPPFWLDGRNEQLWRGAQTLALRPKTFAVLRYLIAQAGQLITQDELLNASGGRLRSARRWSAVVFENSGLSWMIRPSIHGSFRRCIGGDIGSSCP